MGSERWRDIAGASGASSRGRGTRSPTCRGAGRPLAVRERRAHRRDGGRAADAAGAGGRGGRERDGGAHRQDRDRRAGDDGDARLPVRDARGRRRPPRGGARLRAGARELRAAGRRRVRRLMARRLAPGDRGRCRPGARGARGRRGRGHGRRGNRDDVLRLPGGIGTASRVVGDHHVGVLLLCNFGDRERLDLLGTRSSRRAAAGRRARASRSAPPTPPWALIICGAWLCGRCSGWSGSAPTATTARARSASRSRPPSGRSWPATTWTRTSRRPGRRPGVRLQLPRGGRARAVA